MSRFVNFKLAGMGPIAINVEQVVYVRPWAQSNNTQIVFSVGLETAAHSVIVEQSFTDVMAALEAPK
jgi:hypothetical protein